MEALSGDSAANRTFLKPKMVNNPITEVDNVVETGLACDTIRHPSKEWSVASIHD